MEIYEKLKDIWCERIKSLTFVVAKCLIGARAADIPLSQTLSQLELESFHLYCIGAQAAFSGGFYSCWERCCLQMGKTYNDNKAHSYRVEIDIVDVVRHLYEEDQKDNSIHILDRFYYEARSGELDKYNISKKEGSMHGCEISIKLRDDKSYYVYVDNKTYVLSINNILSNLDGFERDRFNIMYKAGAFITAKADLGVIYWDGWCEIFDTDLDCFLVDEKQAALQDNEEIVEVDQEDKEDDYVLVYEDEYGSMSVNFNRCPIRFLFSIGKKLHKCDFNGKPLDEADEVFDTKIKEWLDVNADWLKEMIWEWSLNSEAKVKPKTNLSKLI
ncbi:MAG: hypothetical protein MJ189_01795 [Coriobacteriales bacterium]|nr:hypothetical protein [Coriobacteriales bacterium]